MMAHIGGLTVQRNVTERVTLEVIAVTVDDAIAAERGGADRLELVDALALGGTTPKFEVIRDVKRAVSIPVYVMIRPRGGDFVYSQFEAETMVRQAKEARDVGADGIVVGALRANGTIDIDTVTKVVAAAGLPVTFHKAFDALPPAEIRRALTQLAEIPLIERILTSGGHADAFAGRHAIADMAGRTGLSIIPGGGVTLHNVAQLVAETGVQEIHVGTAARQPHAPTAPVKQEFVRQFAQLLDGIVGGKSTDAG